MNEIINRLQQADGPDRALDVDIVFALYPDIGAYQPHCVGEEPIFWSDPYRKQPCPQFTASIDAALTLLPTDYKWTVGFSMHVPHNAEVWVPGLTGYYDGECDSNRAIALCIAILRARKAASAVSSKERA
ncbi:hypothetical protein ABIF68_007870 [Bradyrhizobium japonicum]|jgi:hypothetical protein|uniref:hypothetical protein n=1 Tax=Bradyrhizobium TaxID=374 RepID=UPI0004B6FB55|nr:MULTISPECIES: hypothetical protein [Bradyrhizobium]MDI2076996.1 hypothetical protein [Bradyrhizobium sp. Mp27]